MIAIVCVDDRNGMAFNGRRQSRDRAVIADILLEAGKKPVWLDKHSVSLFDDFTEKQLKTAEDFAKRAGEGEFCFFETVAPGGFEPKMERIVIYRWNRHYPSDLAFDIPLEAHGWRCVGSCEFPGRSHERITKEVYLR